MAAPGLLEAELSYGLDVFGRLGLVTPYAGLAHSAQGDRSWRLGARLRLDPSFDLSLEGTRAENADGHAAPKHSFTLGGP